MHVATVGPSVLPSLNLSAVDALHTVDDLAEAFGLSAATIRSLCGRHKWPHLKMGRAIRFTDEQVREILQIHTQRVSDEERRVTNLMARTGLTRRSAERHIRNN